MIEADDDFHLVEFAGRNELTGENAQGEGATSDVLLVPYVSRFVASATELFKKRPMTFRGSYLPESITLRFSPFFFLFDRFLNHLQTSFLPVIEGIFHADQLEIQRFFQSETRLNVLMEKRTVGVIPCATLALLEIGSTASSRTDVLRNRMLSGSSVF